MSSFELSDINYEDFVDCGNRLGKYLREEEGCDYVIALTHIRTHNDRKLAKKCEYIDLQLGGHDHTSIEIFENNTLIKKSGTDFRELTHMILEKREQKEADFCHNSLRGICYNFQKIHITKEFEPDPILQEKIHSFSHRLNEQLDKVCGFIKCDLELRFSRVRSLETNMTSMVADLMNFINKTDCLILNSGTFRTDDILHAGPYKLKDLNIMLPIIDFLVTMEVSGKSLHKILENGVSAYPKLEGKFPILSGMTIVYDSKLPPFSRIKKEDIYVRGEKLDYDRNYTVTTRHFISKGKDGYEEFLNCKCLVDDESAILFQDSLIQILQDELSPDKVGTEHRESILKIVNNCEKEIYEENGKRFYTMNPKTDGRILNLSEEIEHLD